MITEKIEPLPAFEYGDRVTINIPGMKARQNCTGTVITKRLTKSSDCERVRIDGNQTIDTISRSFLTKIEAERKKHSPTVTCQDRGFHVYQEFIDPQSGGWMRCKDCSKAVDCEDPDGDMG